MTVTKNTIIAEILNNDPTQGCVPIFLSTGMHCLGCMASHGETVEEACAVHGVDADELVDELNDTLHTCNAPRLDARLAAAYDFDSGARGADIGCDHGKLSAALAGSGRCPLFWLATCAPARWKRPA